MENFDSYSLLAGIGIGIVGLLAVGTLVCVLVLLL
jgi:hypothetical protein